MLQPTFKLFTRYLLDMFKSIYLKKCKKEIIMRNFL
jgi:hypothetical protein